MSRDWTPRENLAFEQLNISRGFGDMWDFMENLVINYNGKSERAYSDEDIALRKQFPALGKLLLDNFSELHEALSAFEGGLELLRERDRELAQYIEAGTGDKSSYLIKWFEGELDPNFHYREYNDQLLVARMCEEALQKGLSNWILTDPDCLQVRRQTGFDGRGVFELIQIEKLPDDACADKAVYLISDGEIDLDDYTQEEIDSTLDCYGYDGLKGLIQAVESRSEADGQLAEMFFELSTSLYTMRFSSWDEALEHIEHRTGMDLSAHRENTCDSLATRLVAFYKDYDLYDYRDSLAPGATDEDAIHYMEEQLKEPASVDGILEALEEFAEDPDLDEEQAKEIAGLVADVKNVKREMETATGRKKPLDEQIRSATEHTRKNQFEVERTQNDIDKG